MKKTFHFEVLKTVFYVFSSLLILLNAVLYFQENKIDKNLTLNVADFFQSTWIISFNLIFLLILFLFHLFISKKIKTLINFSKEMSQNTNSLPFIDNYLNYSDLNRIYKYYKEINLNNKKGNQELETILNHIEDGIILIKPSLKISYFNKKIEQYLLKDINIHDTLQLDQIIRNKQLDDILTDVNNTQKSLEKTIKIYTDKEIQIQINAIPLKNKNILMIFKNITKLIQLENLRKEFIDNVSHELKTPITIINGFLETIKDDEIEKNQKKEFFNIIAKQSNNLSNIIDSLIFITELESVNYKNNIIFQSENITELIKNVIASFKQKLKEKKLTIEFNNKETHYLTINITLFTQLISNLIDNAIKYSDENKKIKIEFEKKKKKFKINVIDEGIGIEEKHIPLLSQRFYRVDKSRNKKTGGSGLGLSIVKHIAHLHQGNITITSKINIGSTFTCEFPI